MFKDPTSHWDKHMEKYGDDAYSHIPEWWSEASKQHRTKFFNTGVGYG